MDPAATFVFILAIFAIFTVLNSIKIVPQGRQYTVERLGRYTKTLEPGLSVIVPFVDRISAKVNIMEQVVDVPSQEVITKDNAQVRVDGVTFFQVLDAAKATYEVSGLQNAILNLVMTNIRSVMGSMDLDELLSNRDMINLKLLQVVDHATQPWGVKITRVEIKDITPPPTLVEAMAQQMKAERMKRASVLEAEGEKQAAILRAQGQQESMILRAEGEKQAAFLGAEARERQAAAEARATSMLSQAIGQGNINAINYFVAQKYIEALGQIASSPNQKVILMPLEASNVIGSLAGIAEIAKETFQMNKDK
ncbi:MAG: SPFH domain-containing protein [Deinococcaceae bacterium]